MALRCGESKVCLSLSVCVYIGNLSKIKQAFIKVICIALKNYVDKYGRIWPIESNHMVMYLHSIT